MHLMFWNKGGKHIHARGKDGKPNPFKTDADRFHFYDAAGSMAYDAATDTWYKDGVAVTPSYPLVFELEDGRTVTIHGKGGAHGWQVQ